MSVIYKNRSRIARDHCRSGTNEVVLFEYLSVEVLGVIEDLHPERETLRSFPG